MGTNDEPRVSTGDDSDIPTVNLSQPTDPAPVARRASRTRLVVAGLGAALYVAGWLMPHSPTSEHALVTIPLVVADGPGAMAVPPGIARSIAEERAAIEAMEPGVHVEFGSTDGNSEVRVSLPDCAVGAACGTDFATAFTEARLSIIDEAIGSRQAAVATQISDSETRTGEARNLAGELADLDATAFQRAALDGAVRTIGDDWQSSFDQLRGYQQMLAERSTQSVLATEQSQLSDAAAIRAALVGQPAITAVRAARNNLTPLILSGVGLLLCLGSLAVARRRFADRPFGLRSGVAAAVGRLLLVAFVIAGALALVAVLNFRSSAERASMRLRSVAEALALDDMPQAKSDLDALREFTTDAENLLAHPAFRLVSLLPGGSEDRNQLDAMTKVVQVNLDAGADFVDTINTIETTPQGYPDRIRLLRDTLADVGDRLTAISTPFGANAAGERFRVDHDELIAGFKESAGNAESLLSSVLTTVDADGQYLVLVGSTSEPRAAMGGYFMIGTAGMDDGGPVLDSVGGIVLDGALTETSVPFVEPGAATVADPDLARNLAGFAVGSDWTTLSLSPRFDATSAAAVEMWQAVGGRDVAGVVYLDPITLRQILFITGPVTVDGTVIDGGNVVTFIDDLQYRGPLGDQTDRAERQDVLRNVMIEVVGRLRDQQPNGAWLRELSVATSTRHLMLWHRGDTPAQSESNGDLAGLVAENSLAVSVGAINGKYDPYLDVAVAGTTACTADGVQVTLNITATFDATVEPHGYLSGSLWFLEQPDTAAVLVHLTLPASAQIDLAQQPPAALSGTDGPVRTYATWLQIERGATETAQVTFSVPAGTELQVEPSGRAYERPWLFDDIEGWNSTPGGQKISIRAC